MFRYKKYTTIRKHSPNRTRAAAMAMPIPTHCCVVRAEPVVAINSADVLEIDTLLVVDDDVDLLTGSVVCI